MPIRDKLSNLIHRNSEKDVNSETTRADAPTNQTIVGKSFELPMEEPALPIIEQNRVQSVDPLPHRDVLAQSTERYPVTIVETVQKDVVVQERIHPVMNSKCRVANVTKVEKEEIQPIIYREREQLEIRQITREEHERTVEATIVQQNTLAPNVLPVKFEGSTEAVTREIYESSSLIEVAQRQQVTLPAKVVDTTVYTNVVEVQPVIQRNILEPVTILQTRPIYEKIVEAPVLVQRQAIEVHEMGTFTGRKDIANSDAFIQDYISGLHVSKNISQAPASSAPLGLAETR
ncbi:hypothetical protein PROFUN_04762 [Planoprotostelium fungivorum]|uniref:Uncharacterized protein n=1 Tax=Planoprotostelium fungivorum TaxID=1890364 RepID=A0A2P6NSV1_9EUKA|nr:hypothetical protein PROFUN_04762 [Planoprotostelium fungivorum]